MERSLSTCRYSVRSKFLRQCSFCFGVFCFMKPWRGRMCINELLGAPGLCAPSGTWATFLQGSTQAFPTCSVLESSRPLGQPWTWKVVKIVWWTSQNCVNKKAYIIQILKIKWVLYIKYPKPEKKNNPVLSECLSGITCIQIALKYLRLYKTLQEYGIGQVLFVGNIYGLCHLSLTRSAGMVTALSSYPAVLGWTCNLGEVLTPKGLRDWGLLTVLSFVLRWSCYIV